MLVSVFFLFVFELCFGQLLFPGPCPEMKAMTDFDINKFLGKWNEVQRMSLAMEHEEDVKYNFGPMENTGIFRFRKFFRGEEGWQTITGQIVQNFPTELNGQLLMSVDDTNVMLYVLGTDYDNYAVIWSCSVYSREISYHESWILGRKNALSKEEISAVADIITANGLEMNNYRSHRTI